MTRLRLLDLPADQLAAEVVAAPYFLDERPPLGPCALLDWRLNGALTEALLCGAATGRFGEQVMVAGNGKVAADWILFAGGGDRRRFDREDFRDLAGHLLGTCRRAGFSRIGLCLPAPDGIETAELARLIEGEENPAAGSDVECVLSLQRSA